MSLPHILSMFVPAARSAAWFAEFQEKFKDRLGV